VSTASISQEEIRPPEPPGPITWARQNLFSSWLNSLVSIVLLGIIAWATIAIVRWVFVIADWRPILNPLLYLVGQYPREEIWRLGVIVMIISFLFGASWRLWGGMIGTFALTYALSLAAVIVWPSLSGSFDASMRIALIANLGIMLIGYLIGGMQFTRGIYLTIGWILSLIVSIFLMNGIEGVEWLPVVPTGNWGGLMVTLLLAVGGIVISFPIGVLLALGRRSSLPVVSIFSTIFIEVVRGVPLIGILFLSSLILPLFLPPDIRIDRLLRALIGMTLFSAAYMAENVRGGLAAVPQGQVEAANALGLNNFQITTLIVLPQALRAVIPPIVGQFISLFKDTTLASGVAVLELLSVGRSILQANPEYIGLQMEVYLFIAAIFWVLSYMMSYASLRLEVALGVGER
jgi:general L-amino acid transport system permease protein